MGYDIVLAAFEDLARASGRLRAVAEVSGEDLHFVAKIGKARGQLDEVAAHLADILARMKNTQNTRP